MVSDTPESLANVVHAYLKRKKLPLPDMRVLTRLLDALFLASLHTEEQRLLACSVTYIDPDDPDPKPPLRIRGDRWGCYELAHQLRLNVANLSRLAPAVDPSASSLAVYPDYRGRLMIWGIIDQVALHYSRFVTGESAWGPEVPGLFHAVVTGVGELSVYHEYEIVGTLRKGSLNRQHLDVLRNGPVSRRLSNFIRIFSERVPAGVRAKLSNDTSPEEEVRDTWVATLARILLAIRGYRHGGALLLVPQRHTPTLNIRYKISYDRIGKTIIQHSVSRHDYELSQEEIFSEYLDEHEDMVPAEVYLGAETAHDDLIDCSSALAGAVRFIASLSCVDGLILAGPSLEVRGFGVEILAEKDVPSVFVAGGVHANPSGLKRRDSRRYGMRHRSMVRFCASNPESLGFVVSQDGDVRAVMNLHGQVVIWENVQLQLQLSTTKSARRKKSSAS